MENMINKQKRRTRIRMISYHIWIMISRCQIFAILQAHTHVRVAFIQKHGSTLHYRGILHSLKSLLNPWQIPQKSLASPSPIPGKSLDTPFQLWKRRSNVYTALGHHKFRRVFYTIFLCTSARQRQFCPGRHEIATYPSSFLGFPGISGFCPQQMCFIFTTSKAMIYQLYIYFAVLLPHFLHISYPFPIHSLLYLCSFPHSLFIPWSFPVHSRFWDLPPERSTCFGKMYHIKQNAAQF